MYGELGSGLSMAREVEARLTLPQVRAVALPSRLRILRCLAKQRATVTEIAKRTGIPKSTALKHLRALERHALVEAKKDERLWVYYDLTRAGRMVGRLNPLRIYVLACLMAAAAFFVAAIGAWVWGRWTRATDDPWGIPPIGVSPTEPVARALTLGFLLAGALLVAIAAWLWRRSRAGRGDEPDHG